MDRWRKVGLDPGYVPGMLRFDRHALDAALDKLSDIVSWRAESEPEFDPLAPWRKDAQSGEGATR